jgi:hypothetical protein
MGKSDSLRHTVSRYIASLRRVHLESLACPRTSRDRSNSETLKCTSYFYWLSFGEIETGFSSYTPARVRRSLRISGTFTLTLGVLLYFCNVNNFA